MDQLFTEALYALSNFREMPIWCRCLVIVTIVGAPIAAFYFAGAL